MSYARLLVDFVSQAPRVLRYLERETKEEGQNIESAFQSLSSIPATIFNTVNNIGRAFNQKNCDAALIRHLNSNKSSIYNKGNEITLDQVNQIWQGYERYKNEKKQAIKNEVTLLFKELKDCETTRV